MTSKELKLVICGTDTDVGKTIVSALFVQGLNAIYWKPIQSGLDEADTDKIRTVLNLSSERYFPEAFRFQAPVSPHWAAEQEGQCVDPSQLKIPSVKAPLVIETAGGLMVPLNRQLLQIEQLKLWGLPVLLVARTGLGTLNHTLLSLEALRVRNIPVLALVLNGPPHADNPKTLEEFGGIPVICELPPLNELTASTLNEQWEKQRVGIKFKRLWETRGQT